MKIKKVHNEKVQSVFGRMCALLQVGFLIADYAEPEGIDFCPVYLAFALLFLASAHFASQGLQAGLFFAMAAQQTVTSQNCFYGLAFAVVAVLILFRGGWFLKKALGRAITSAATGSAVLIMPIVVLNKSPIALVLVFICVAIYSIIVFGLAKGRCLSALAPKKSILRLADYKLTRREIQIVKARLLGKTIKEFAYENGIAESTVRNALSLSYHKLGIPGGEELMALGERYLIE
jgi:DNA-binding CsgD family transcriptional regulator